MYLTFKQIVISLCLATLVGCSTGSQLETRASLEDTPANRKTQAERYLKAMPPREMMTDLAEKMATAMPGAPALDLEGAFERMDFETLESAVAESLKKHFTAEELRSLADFYASPTGKSAMGKMGDYMVDVMPVMQKVIMDAMQQP